MIKPYWHKIPKDDQESVLKYSGLTVGEFMKKYRQPKWCGYHSALEGQMGCWSLMVPGRIIGIESCSGCELLRSEK